MAAEPLPLVRHRAVSSFDTVFHEQRPALLRFLRRRLDNDADVDEIAQEAYLRLLRYSEDQEVGALKALLYRIAINLVAMHHRQSRSQHAADHVSLDGEEIESADIAQDRQLESRDQLRMLMAAIRGLPRNCRQVFLLSRFQEMSYQEIAVHCGISVKMVEKHVSKALAVCRRKAGPLS